MKQVSKKTIIFLQLYITLALLLLIFMWDKGTTSKAATLANFDIPVSVVLSEGSDIPPAGTTYTFKLETLNNAPMPSTTTITLDSPSATGESNKISDSFHISTDQWGSFTYKLTETSGAAEGYTMDSGFWTIYINIASDGTLSSMNWSYTESLTTVTSDSFNIVKHISSGTYETAASVSTNNGSVCLLLGGDKVISSSLDSYIQFNTAVIESKFTIDFRKDFEVSGRFIGAASPDGSWVGFIPSNDSVPDSSSLNIGGAMAIYGTEFAKNAIVLEFDSYDNSSNFGDNGIGGIHFSLVGMDSAGNPSVVNNQSYKYTTWPSSQGTYSIRNNTQTNKLTFSYKASDNSTQTWTYDNPTSKLGNTAKITLGGSIRRAGSYSGIGAVGTTAPKTEIFFDVFNYTGNREGYSSNGVFVNSYTCPHTNWTYSSENNILKAKCSGCDGDCPTYPNAIELKLIPNANANISGDTISWTTVQSASFSFADSTEWVEAFGESNLPQIMYIGTGSTEYEESTSPPGVAGSYKAFILVNSTKAEVPFTIKQVYMISYNNNGGNGAKSSIYVEPQNYTLPLCDFKPPLNKEFDGWSLSSSGPRITTTTTYVSDNITLYARWKEHIHRITTLEISDGITKQSCDCGFYVIQFE